MVRVMRMVMMMDDDDEDGEDDEDDYEVKEADPGNLRPGQQNIFGPPPYFLMFVIMLSHLPCNRVQGPTLCELFLLSCNKILMFYIKN